MIQVGSIVAGNERSFPAIGGKIGIVISFSDKYRNNPSRDYVNRWKIYWFESDVRIRFPLKTSVFLERWLTVIVP